MAAVGMGSVHGQRGARFAAACGVLSRYVKAAAAAVDPRPAVLPLMPGADVSPSSASAQLTISYGGRTVVVDDVPADRAAELLRVAAAAAAAPRRAEDDLLPVARKASLQRFMEKRRGRRAAARGSPYGRPDAAATSPDSLTLAL